ncbi:MAG: ArsR family transcriptional regulator [Archaeoglobaceae archaeon]
MEKEIDFDKNKHKYYKGSKVEPDMGKEGFDTIVETPRINFNEKHEKVLKIISRNGICPILFTLDSKPMKFSELMFETRLNPGVVDRHLKCLYDLGIVEREDNYYQLTENGKKIIPVIEQFLTMMEKL